MWRYFEFSPTFDQCTFPAGSLKFHQETRNQLYTVRRATPTALATSAQPLPASSVRPAFNRLFVASLNRFCAMTTFCNITLGDPTLQLLNGCHVLWKYQ